MIHTDEECSFRLPEHAAGPKNKICHRRKYEDLFEGVIVFTNHGCLRLGLRQPYCFGPVAQNLSLLQYDKIYWHVQMDNLVYFL